MKVSVVIPAYNEEAYIGPCLDAVMAQSQVPYEVIVVDNNSTDRTAEVARAKGAKVVLCTQKGVAAARQAGLEAATGDWIASTDSDTRPTVGWLEAFRPHTQQAVALYGPVRLYDVSEFEAGLADKGYRTFLHLMAWVGRPNLSGQNMAFHRESALAVGGYPKVYTSEDVRLGWQLLTQGPIHYVPQALVETSPRRIKNNGLPKFLWMQVRNLFGVGGGYFKD